MIFRKTTIALTIAACLAAASSQLHAEDPNKFSGSLEAQLRTNDDIRVAPGSTSSFDFADFGDFDAAEERLDGDDDEDDSDDEEAEGDSDDFDDVGLDDTELSEEDFDLAVDDDDGDGDEDDEDDDGNDDDDGGGQAKDADLDDLIAAQLGDKMSTQRKSQSRYSGQLSLGHKYTFAGGNTVWGSTLRLVGDYHNGKSSLNKSNFALSTGPEFKIKKLKLKIKPALSYVAIRQDGNKVIGTLVGSLAGSYDPTKRLSFDAAYNYQDRDVTDPDSPDAIINTLTFGAEFTATKADIFKFKYSPKVEDASLVTKNKDTKGWQFSYSRKLPWDMILGLGVKDDSVDFVRIPTRRSDDIRAYDIELAKRFNKSFEMAISYETRELDSNINTKDAENRSYMISGTWKF
jgi:hypothetical protein